MRLPGLRRWQLEDVRRRPSLRIHHLADSWQQQTQWPLLITSCRSAGWPASPRNRLFGSWQRQPALRDSQHAGGTLVVVWSRGRHQPRRDAGGQHAQEHGSPVLETFPHSAERVLTPRAQVWTVVEIAREPLPCHRRHQPLALESGRARSADRLQQERPSAHRTSWKDRGPSRKARQRPRGGKFSPRSRRNLTLRPSPPEFLGSKSLAQWWARRERSAIRHPGGGLEEAPRSGSCQTRWDSPRSIAPIAAVPLQARGATH